MKSTTKNTPKRAQRILTAPLANLTPEQEWAEYQEFAHLLGLTLSEVDKAEFLRRLAAEERQEPPTSPA